MATITLKVINIEEVDADNVRITVEASYRGVKTGFQKVAPKTVTVAQVKEYAKTHAPLLKQKIDRIISRRQPWERFIGSEWEITV